MLGNGSIDERSVRDFLVYSNSVIKSRAIPRVEDNLKPIHRKILYTLWEDKVFADKPTRKCATEAGRALAYSPHGDASVYGAMVRLSQWWKLRYPLIEMQGNCGNLLGDSAAASRYTECRLSPIGMLMLEDLNKNCVEFKPNYDETTVEPTILPSKFPWLLCGNNSGIAVGMSSDLVSHNFTEVAAAINYYMSHKDTCTLTDILQFIKGPDFPTGGKITNGEELFNIYSSGRGSLRMEAHYEVSKKGNKTIITFKDIPYGVEIESGVKAPLKKLILDEGYDIFEEIDVRKAGPRNFDIIITLGKNANVAQCLDILFTKTRLADSVKVNQTVIVNGEPRTMGLMELIRTWVDYRSNIITKIAINDFTKTQHKLTVVLGLQKCLSDIDLLVSLIRNADSRAAAKIALMNAFAINDEQADAVLDMKLSRLSRLDLQDLNKERSELEQLIQRQRNIIDDENARYAIISDDLKTIKQMLGEDKRLTEVVYSKPAEFTKDAVAIRKEWRIYPNGLRPSVDGSDNVGDDLVDIQFAYNADQLWGYTKDGEMMPIEVADGDLIGAVVYDDKLTNAVLVTVTKNGNVKLSHAAEFKWSKKKERIMKIKEGDELVFAALADQEQEFLVLYGGTDYLLKIPLKDLTIAGKTTVGVKSGYSLITSALTAKDSDLLLMVTTDNKAKLTPVKDLSVDSRGNKGQLIAAKTAYVRYFDNARTHIYIIPKTGKSMSIDRTKISIKGKTATGAALTNRAIENIY